VNRVHALECGSRVQGEGLQDAEFGLQGAWFGVQGLEFRG
jgi:hypothetical protein